VLLDRGLRARGHQTLLVHGSVDAGEGMLDHMAAEAAIPTVRIGDLGRRISVLSDVRAFYRLLRLTFREAPDVLHTHTAKAGALGRLAGFAFNLTRPRDKRCVIVHTFHGHVLSGYFPRWGSLLVRFAERRLAAITDRVVTISPLQRYDIVNRFTIAADARTSIIPLGLDLEALRHPSGGPDLRRELGISASDIVIGYVGRFAPIKDLGTLLRAFILAARREPRLSLLLVGDGPLRPELETIARQSGVQDRIRFLGWIQNLVPVYDAIDVCALSSLNEGTPVSIIEAMAAGKAVVATAVGGVPDVIEDGKTGILFPAGGAGALATALVRLAASPSERMQMGQSGRAAVFDRFSPDRLVDDIERLYAEALTEKRLLTPATVERTS
jgi:glycosyltransferase involved in cell wall biosynthesis